MRIGLYAVYGKEIYCYCIKGIKILRIDGKYDDLHLPQKNRQWNYILVRDVL